MEIDEELLEKASGPKSGLYHNAAMRMLMQAAQAQRQALLDEEERLRELGKKHGFPAPEYKPPVESKRKQRKRLGKKGKR